MNSYYLNIYIYIYIIMYCNSLCYTTYLAVIDCGFLIRFIKVSIPFISDLFPPPCRCRSGRVRGPTRPRLARNSSQMLSSLSLSIYIYIYMYTYTYTYTQLYIYIYIYIYICLGPASSKAWVLGPAWSPKSLKPRNTLYTLPSEPRPNSDA